MTTGMNSALKESMTAGVFVEFRDAAGHTLATEAYFDWNGRPVPAVGDDMCCVIHARESGRKEKIYGRVRQRQFDVQRDEAGDSSVWLYLVLETTPTSITRPGRKPPRFSNN